MLIWSLGCGSYREKNIGADVSGGRRSAVSIPAPRAPCLLVCRHRSRRCALRVETAQTVIVSARK